jgi:hypothetical protein
MISWLQLLGYSESKPVRGFDFFVVLSVAVGNLNEALKSFDVALYLPWIYHFWFIGGVANLAGVFSCRTLSPHEIRLYRSVEKYIDAKRAAAVKSSEDDASHVLRESSAISTAVFSALGVELNGEQKKSIAERLFDHFNSRARRSSTNHSNVLSKEWALINVSWSWRKIVVTLLFGVGLVFYTVFLILLFLKGWNAIRSN